MYYKVFLLATIGFLSLQGMQADHPGEINLSEKEKKELRSYIQLRKVINYFKQEVEKINTQRMPRKSIPLPSLVKVGNKGTGQGIAIIESTIRSIFGSTKLPFDILVTTQILKRLQKQIKTSEVWLENCSPYLQITEIDGEPLPVAQAFYGGFSSFLGLSNQREPVIVCEPHKGFERVTKNYKALQRFLSTWSEEKKQDTLINYVLDNSNN